MLDATTLRQTANNLAKAAGTLTEQAFASGGDLSRLAEDLAMLKAVSDICRGMARRIEARLAQEDDSAPLCLGCRHRVDGRGGLDCALALDPREATTRHTCKRYEAE